MAIYTPNTTKGRDAFLDFANDVSELAVRVRCANYVVQLALDNFGEHFDDEKSRDALFGACAYLSTLCDELQQLSDKPFPGNNSVRQ